MAILERQIIQLLNKVVAQKDEEALQVALDHIVNNLEKPALLGRRRTYAISRNVYLFCAEAAFAIRKFDVVSHCLDRLYELPPTRTDFLIRAHYLSAQLCKHNTSACKGKELVNGTQESLAKILNGIYVACADPTKHAYLVAEGLVRYWDCGRILYRQGLYGELLTTLPSVVKAIEAIDYKEHGSRALWMLRNAVCCSMCGRQAEANIILQKTMDFVVRFQPSLKNPVYRIQVALTKYAANPKVRTDANTNLLKGILAVQSVAAGIVTDKTAIERELTEGLNALLDKTKSAKPPPKQAPKKGGDKKPDEKGEDKRSDEKEAANKEERERDEVLGEIAVQAALHGFISLAEQLDQVVCKSKAMKARILSEYTRGLLQAQSCTGFSLLDERFYNHTPFLNMGPTVSGLLAAVRKIEKAVDSASRSRDSQLVHAACILIWNLSLPLLQAPFRKQIRKSLATALGALEAINSNLHLLQSQLQLEIAKCDIAEELLTKASVKLDEAIAIDYVVSEEEREETGYERPLDKYSVPLKEKCELISNIYVLPENVEDEATLIVEQAKDASNAALRLSLVERAARLLEADEPPLPVPTQEPEEEKEEEKPKAKGKKAAKKKDEVVEEVAQEVLDPAVEEKKRKRAVLWAAIINIAWSQKSKSAKFINTVRKAAAYLHRISFTKIADRDLRTEQATAFYAVAETYIYELKQKDMKLGSRFEVNLLDEERDVELMQEKAAANTLIVSEAERNVCANLVKGIAKGQELVAEGLIDHWVVYNGCINFWNWHAEMFSNKDYLPIRKCAETCYRALGPIFDPRDTQLLVNLSVTYIKSLVQHFIRKMSPASMTDVEVIRINPSTFEKYDGASQELKAADEVCEEMIAKLKPMDAKQFHVMIANIRRLMARVPEPKGTSQEKVLFYLQMLGNPIKNPTDPARFVAEGYLALSENPNIELTTRLAEMALAHPDCCKTNVMICQVGKALEQQGLLGLTENAPIPVSYEPMVPRQESGKGKDKKADKAPPPASLNATTTASDMNVVKVDPKPEHWTWYSKLMYYSAKATLMMISREQPKATQRELRRHALVDILKAVKSTGKGTRDFREEAVQNCIQLFALTCVGFTGDVAGRAALYPTLLELLDQVPSTGIHQTPDYSSALLYLYLALFECLKDRQESHRGIEKMKEALLRLPRTHHKALWEADIEFRCRLSLNPTQTLHRTKEYDTETQARAWLTLARFAKERKDQLFAYQNCIEVVSDKPVLQAEYLCLFATWLFTNGYPLQDVTDHLDSAADLITDALGGHEDEEYGDTRSVASSRKSRSSVGRSAGASSVVSGRSMASRSIKSGGGSTKATRSMAGTSVASASKVEKDKTSQVKLQELLARIYVMLAMIAEPGAQERLDCLTLAHHYYMMIWHSSKKTLNADIKAKQDKAARDQEKLKAMGMFPTDVEIPVPVIEDPPQSAGKKPASTKAAKKSPSPAPIAAEPPSSPTKTEDVMTMKPLVLPESLQGWAGYKVEDKFLNLLKRRADESTMNRTTIGNVQISLFYLNSCGEMLKDSGMDIHVLPLLSLMHAMSRVCLSSVEPTTAALTSLQTLRMSTLHMKLQASDISEEIIPTGAELAIKQADRSEFLEAIKQMQEHPSIVSNEDEDPSYAEVITLTNTVSMREVWISTAMDLIDAGKLSLARALLTESLLHAKAWYHSSAHGWCLHLLAKVAFLDGKMDKALKLNQASVNLRHGSQVDLKLFIHVMSLMVRLHLDVNTLERALCVEEEVDSVLEHARTNVSYHCPSDDTALMLGRRLDTAKATFLINAVNTVIRYYLQESMSGTIPVAFLDKLFGFCTQAKRLVGPSKLDQARCLATEYYLRQASRAHLPVPSGDALLAMKPKFVAEKRLLEQCLTLTQAILMEDALPLGTLATSKAQLVCPIQQLQAEVMYEMACNILNRLEIYHIERRLHGINKMLVPDFPKAEGRSELEPAIFDFFRMTDKQKRSRDRAIRRKEKEERLKEEQKLKEEQMRIEAEKAAEAELASKDDKKKKKPGKADRDSPLPRHTPSADIPPEPIVPAPVEESSGSELDDSEEEALEAERRKIWLRNSGQNEENESLPQLPEALSMASTALSISEGTFLGAKCRGLLGRCMRAMFEIRGITEEIKVTFDIPETGLVDHFIHKLWNEPLGNIDVVPVEEGDKKGAKKSAGKDAKGAGGKDKKGGKRADQGTPPPPIDDLAMTIPQEPCATNPQVPLLAQASENLQQALVEACEVDDWTTGTEIALSLAKCYIHSNRAIAGRWVMLAQSLQHAQETIEQLVTTFEPETREASYLRLLRKLQQNPMAGRTSQYEKVRAILMADSATYRHVQIPPSLFKDGAIMHFGAPVPSGVYVLSIFHSIHHKHFYATLMRGGSSLMLTARAKVDRALLTDLLATIEQWDQEREAACTADSASLANFWNTLEHRYQTEIVGPMLELLRPLLDPHIMPLLKRDPGCSLIIIPSNPLHPLPLEAYPGLEGLMSVTRDFSLHMAQGRYDTESKYVDKFIMTTNFAYVVDPFNEDHSISQSVAAKFPAGKGAGTGYLSGAVNRPSSGEWQRVLTNPLNMLFLFSGIGRLASSVNLGEIAGLDLRHVRCGILIDQGINESGSRRQSKHALTVSEARKPLERPEMVANLLSCRGMNGIVSNLYSTQIPTNTRIVNFILGLLEKGVTLHDNLHDILRKDREVELPPTSPTPDGKKAKGEKKPAKGDVTMDPETMLLCKMVKSDRFNLVMYGLPVY